MKSDLESIVERAHELSNDLARFVGIYEKAQNIDTINDNQQIAIYVAERELGNKYEEFYQDLLIAKSKGLNDRIISYYFTHLSVIHDATIEFRKYIKNNVVDTHALSNISDYKLVVKYCGLNPVFNWINSIADTIIGLGCNEMEYNNYLQEKYFQD